MENSKSKNIIIYILLIIILLFIGYDVYLRVNDSKKLDNQEENVVQNVEKMAEDNIITGETNNFSYTDTYAFYADIENKTAEYYLLVDGNLYYKKVNINNGYYGTYDFDAGSGNKELTKFNGLSNIIRIKGANTLTSGTGFNVILITGDGKVYSYQAGESSAKLNEDLVNYNINDIEVYSVTSGCIQEDDNFKTCGGSYKFTTNDEKLYDITVKQNGDIVEN